MTSVADVAANLATARRLLRQARDGGACLAVLPENFCFMGRTDAERRDIVEADGDGPVQQAVSAMARELGLWIVAGTQPIAIPGEPMRANASIVYDGEGRRAARYDKIHLFDVDLPDSREGYRESSNAIAGAKPVTVDTPAGRLGTNERYVSSAASQPSLFDDVDHDTRAGGRRLTATGNLRGSARVP